ncbi:hypothetical protein IT893_04805 [Thalassospira sp. A40-3]|uniref:hypothetical protein n=1 Tax=Thalassospira sp. A40-3 TaxID=2785908 RepID=UPI0018CE43C0|nr:hypothetical protein [Thalassospira sp. A40-3]QPO12846.1 hypothetical protein IT893_04805 [Thalassospira sp. A40-3]
MAHVIDHLKNDLSVELPDDIAMARNFANIVLGSFDGADKAMNGHLRNLACWPAKLSNARLSELSTV